MPQEIKADFTAEHKASWNVDTLSWDPFEQTSWRWKALQLIANTESHPETSYQNAFMLCAQTKTPATEQYGHHPQILTPLLLTPAIPFCSMATLSTKTRAEEPLNGQEDQTLPFPAFYNFAFFFSIGPLGGGAPSPTSSLWPSGERPPGPAGRFRTSRRTASLEKGGRGRQGTLEEQVQKYESYFRVLEGPVVLSHPPPLISSPESAEASGSYRVKLSGLEISEKGETVQCPNLEQQLEGVESSGSPCSSDMESGNESEWSKDFAAPNSSPPAAASGQKDPLGILTKVFPSHKRSKLKSILQFCKGDVVQAIEQILNRKENKQNVKDFANPSRSELSALQRASNFSLTGLGVGAFGNTSAFSPLQTSSTSFGNATNLYGLNPRLGISPLKLAYSTPGRGLPGFMSPYLTPGLVPALSFHPAMDYSFSGVIKDASYFPSKESVTSGGIYSRLNQENQ
nr:doublesex- and mab-3-related transcription factor A1-like [Chelonoidis abingdonii]